MEEKYCLNLPPNNKEISLTKFSHKGWDFYSHSENMMNSKDLDILIKNKDENKLHINHLPEIFYGFNRLFLINKSKNFCYEFNPLSELCPKKKIIKRKRNILYPKSSKISIFKD